MCVQYWPTDLDKPEEYGNLEITLLAEEQLANFFIRTFKIRKVLLYMYIEKLSFMTKCTTRNLLFPVIKLKKYMLI